MPVDTNRFGALARRIFEARFRALGRNDDEHLFRSSVNAERLMRAHADSVAGKGEPFAVEQLRKEFGLGAR